jgi:hypothetical protein
MGMFPPRLRRLGREAVPALRHLGVTLRQLYTSGNNDKIKMARIKQA